MTLPEYITANLEREFAYGRFDCVLFAATWIKESTDRDILSDVPGWTSQRSANRVIANLGGLVPAFDAKFECINPHAAVDGDLGMWNGCIGIFSGPHIVCAGPQKLEFIDRTECLIAWRS